MASHFSSLLLCSQQDSHTPHKKLRQGGIMIHWCALILVAFLSVASATDDSEVCSTTSDEQIAFET